MPRCPLGQQPGPLTPKAAASPSPSPTLRGQAGRPPPPLTYSARWLCTACPGPIPEPRVGTGGHRRDPSTLSAAAPGPLPQQPHCSLLGISAIKAVGVASTELGPPLPHSPGGGHCPAWLRGGQQGAPPPASKEQWAGPGAGAQRGLLRAAGPGSGLPIKAWAPLAQIQDPPTPCRRSVMEPLCFSMPCAHPCPP